jgi:hypothetical protein
MCTVLLPQGGYQTAANKYIISYQQMRIIIIIIIIIIIFLNFNKKCTHMNTIKLGNLFLDVGNWRQLYAT